MQSELFKEFGIPETDCEIIVGLTEMGVPLLLFSSTGNKLIGLDLTDASKLRDRLINSAQDLKAGQIQKYIDEAQRLQVTPPSATHHVNIETTVDSKVSYQAGTSRQLPTGGQRISVRRGGWTDRGPSTEIETTQRFSRAARERLQNFEKVSQDSDVDIIGRSEDGELVEQFQITRLWPENLWRDLNHAGAVDVHITSQDLTNFVLKAVERKAKYSEQQRSSLILLIDTTPEGILPSLIPDIRTGIAGNATLGSFQEVWLIGRDKDRIFKIKP